jgi:7-carboxy-7-deazaguanine synthase
LRCTWCDSTFTFTGGDHRSIDDVVQEVLAFGIRLVEVTGGEPLVHRQVPELIRRLQEKECEVLVETSGSIDISVVPDGAKIIMDLKPPDSGEVEANLWANLGRLRPGDELKFVLASRRDYEWSRDVVRKHDLEGALPVLFSPVHGQLIPSEIAEWLVEDKLDVRLQLQLHKLIWPPDARGV